MTPKPSPYVILVAVAFDPTGDCALREAARTAQRHDKADLHVVHVVNESRSVELNGATVAIDVRLAEAREELRTRVEALVTAESIKITGHIREGTAERVVLQVAADIDADLIVVGTHKHSGVRKFMLGSVAERVLRDAHCPVLVAMAKDHPRAAEASIIEPPCPECVAVRAASAGANHWCERHSRTRLRPHVYEPSDARRAVPVM